MEYKPSRADKKAALQKLKLTNPIHFLALGFGSGKAPIMPGTFGSAAAIPLLLSFLYLPIWGQILLTIMVCAIGVYLCDVAAKDMQMHDHSAIVWDEIAGMFITFIAVPINEINLLLGFLLFRFFDVLKPWPIGWCDKKVHGGLGIMLDDILAGLMALIVLQTTLYFGLLPF